MLDSSDLTYYRENNEIKAGGFKVDDIIKYEGSVPYAVPQSGGKGDDKLGVPSGIFYLSQYAEREFVPFNTHKCISEDLYENLLDLVKDKKKSSKISKKRSPKKQIKRKHSKTRKYN